MSKTDKALEDVRRHIAEKRKLVELYKKTWEKTIEHPDDMTRTVAKSFMNILNLLENSYIQLEGLFVLTRGLKKQNQIMLDVMTELSKVNPGLDKILSKRLREYDLDPL